MSSVMTHLPAKIVFSVLPDYQINQSGAHL
jgi:hypothetical protein